MSWLFGLDKNQGVPEAPQVPVLGGEGGGEGGSPDSPQPVGGQDEGYRSEAYSFDSSALERAARAAKDLEKSKFAKEALALSQKQEETKQQEQMVKIKEYEMSMEQIKNEGKRVNYITRNKK